MNDTGTIRAAGGALGAGGAGVGTGVAGSNGLPGFAGRVTQMIGT
jgi:hypothetical protein